MRQVLDRRRHCERHPPGLLQPLRERGFRLIWSASILSNLGQLVQGVGAAWEMTRLSDASSMVALVQSATFLPVMLLSLPAGAMADMIDRRTVGLVGLVIVLLSAVSLTVAMMLRGQVGAWPLLGFCLLIGVGVAIFTPAWQASVRELVRPEQLPIAVALNSVSFNVARSVGPAVGGIVVATFGSAAAFGVSALLYVPMAFAWSRSKREPVASKLLPQRIDEAIVGGVRYVVQSPSARTAVLRTLISSLAGASMMALAPLVAKHLLGGGATSYGLLLGAYGAGAIVGATLIAPLRVRMSPESIVRSMAVFAGLAVAVIGVSRSLPITLAAFFIAGSSWMVQNATFNVGAQLSAPHHVTARVLGCWSAAITAGLTIGAWLWGEVANQFGTGIAYISSGVVVTLTALMGRWLPMLETAEGRWS